ncbi:helix-turn-helix transcriptional regulator [Dietzia alimentaria]|uniref:helix-turn-helix transcriptional regulator n=1 Tax=Dietzia alimentaria TaxID=665550 RepID=UPI000299D06A|nr:helix-turn-helix domain-containing protein [Dietzia alimentaria]
MDDDDSGIIHENVLAAIRTAPTPPTVREISDSLGLHPNSVRLHAAALKDAGMIVQENRAGGGRGRPQVTYRTTSSGAWTGRRDYQLLASLLLSELGRAGSEATGEARRVGRTWGRKIANGRQAQEPSERIVAVLDELGFEPTTDAANTAGLDPNGSVLELRNCPFRELVDSRDNLVCALHAGMLDGLADADRAGGQTTVELFAFTSPQACTVRMRDR